MIESMTGYGSGEYLDGSLRASAEIRSVNNRYAEISVKLPRQFISHELEAKEIIRKALHRGKVSANIQLERNAGSEPLAIQINAEMVTAYSAMLHQIQSLSGIQDSVKLEHLLRFSDIFSSTDEDSELQAREWSAICEALNRAIQALREMRQKEGAELVKDFRLRIENINEALTKIETLSEQTIRETREKLRMKVKEVLGDESKISRERLEMEIVLISDKLDITEECVRFRSHNKLFLEILESNDPDTGRKLNFLLQEQGREANTIASKSQNASISQMVVYLKEELERIREQVQNVQ
ncbi:domain of unknown function DUF1732 [Chloroherpeton thalassium ATCC 35110]|uniref:YicC domain protein n=2 Tax=Chloroherpeton thalassium TaxID=100716 RepID=B3QXA5_CHLT3|nr:domain of unknown function DUF1732 [Chloroherpeton thalassium ATCC 35110]